MEVDVKVGGGGKSWLRWLPIEGMSGVGLRVWKMTPLDWEMC